MGKVYAGMQRRRRGKREGKIHRLRNPPAGAGGAVLIAIESAREVLGKAGANLTDAEVAELCRQAEALARWLECRADELGEELGPPESAHAVDKNKATRYQAATSPPARLEPPAEKER